MRDGPESEQAELFPLLDAVPDPRQMIDDQRRALLDDTYRAVIGANGGTYALTGGTETALMWDATMRTFVHGIWAGSIVCAQATCERTMASLLELHYAVAPEPRGWRSWGLGRLIDHHREHDLVDPALLQDIQRVCEARKPFGHLKLPLEPGSLPHVGMEALSRGEPFVEAQEVYVAKTAVLCIQTTIRVYFGDLWGRMPSPFATDHAEP
mgnify:CR=1 FL=1